MNDDDTTQTPTTFLDSTEPVETTELERRTAWRGLPRGRAWAGAAAALVAVSGLTGFGIGHATAGSDLAPASATVDPGSTDTGQTDPDETGRGPRSGGPGLGTPPALPPDTEVPDDAGTAVPDDSSSV